MKAKTSDMNAHYFIASDFFFFFIPHWCFVVFSLIGVTILLSLTVFLNMVAGMEINYRAFIDWQQNLSQILLIILFLFVLSLFMLPCAPAACLRVSSLIIVCLPDYRNYACNFRCELITFSLNTNFFFLLLLPFSFPIILCKLLSRSLAGSVINLLFKLRQLLSFKHWFPFMRWNLVHSKSAVFGKSHWIPQKPKNVFTMRRNLMPKNVVKSCLLLWMLLKLTNLCAHLFINPCENKMIRKCFGRGRRRGLCSLCSSFFSLIVRDCVSGWGCMLCVHARECRNTASLFSWLDNTK